MFEDLKAELESKLNKRVIEKEVTKGNVTRLAFIIGNKEDLVGTVIYPEDWVNSPIDKLLKYINDSEADRQEIVDKMDSVLNFEEMKPKLILCLGPKMNDDAIVTKRFLDMDAYVRIVLTDSYTIKVRNEFLETWGITEDELFRIAEQNMDYKILQFEDEAYVITTNNLFYGASAIMNKDILKEVRDLLETDVLIVPTSVHEVMIIPRDSERTIGLESMISFVKMMNKEHLAPCDVLSNNVYLYDGECRIIS